MTARFNELVTERLREGARTALLAAGVAADDLTEVWVPGALELPLAALWLARSGRHDAIVVLGAVIRGGTDHYEHVCTQAARGLLDTSLRTGVPIGFGLLTCENLDQAIARAGGGSDADGASDEGSNKGEDAALAALAMLEVRDEHASD